MSDSRSEPGLIPLYQPKPTRVTIKGGAPATVLTRSGVVKVIQVLDRWRVDDRWWTQSPASRMYWRVELEGHRVEELYQDLLSPANWYLHRYVPPEEPLQDESGAPLPEDPEDDAEPEAEL